MADRVEARIDVRAGAKPDSPALSAAQQAQLASALPTGVLFSAPSTGPGGARRQEPVEWPLAAARPYKDQTATGTAYVYYGAGHTSLVRPMIFADGFNYGPSDLPDLFEHLNHPYAAGQDGLLDQLLAAGVDIILLGFAVRHTHIQANAEVAMSCIRQANAEREGAAPLIVGGVSMGGLITRYALASMETDGEDHQSDIYLSFDSPHNGAWIPVMLQQLAYFAEKYGQKPPPGQPSQADLIKSPAAQQLLWAWVPASDYSGPVATASPLRGEFLADLERVGSFPARPRNLGVSNGTANGTGKDVPAGAQVFDWSYLIADATALTQPAGTDQYVGGKKYLIRNNSYTTAIPPLDGAPGGTLDSYGMVATGLGIDIDSRFHDTCFVPSISSAALHYDNVTWPIDPYTNISALDLDSSDLDDFQCDITNSLHSQVTPVLAEWILTQLTK
jgi:hypothetical protein